MQQSSPQQFLFPLLTKQEVGAQTWRFSFSRKGVNYQFKPGQYNRVSLPINATDGKGSSRSFTISSSPLDSDIMTLTTKEGTSDFKRSLFDLKEGELVTFEGPKGGFFLRDEDNSEKVFLAGGIGITPFYSMIKYMTQKNLPHKVSLFANFSGKDDVIYQEELLELTKNNPNFQLIFTLSKQERAQSWSGEKGKITAELLRKYLTDIHVPSYYIVGPAAMVASMEEMLEEMGIEEGKIKLEQFDGY